MIATIRRHAGIVTALAGLMFAAGVSAVLIRVAADAVVYAMEHSP